MGGSREALMASENQRNMGTAMNQAIGTGYNNAFQAAQQAQQFGANLGLQGNQAALSGLGQANTAAGTLGQLGAGQLAGEQSIIGTQNQVGAQQQAQQQQITNQAIQDYANAQQYPMMQLGMMSNMLRGLPMQATTTQTYQAQPNLVTQGIGALGTGMALSNAMGTPAKAEGGVIKSYAKGGLASIQSYDVGGDVKGDLYDYSPEKLQEIIRTSESETVRNLARSVLKDKTGMAGGGMVAFKEGDKVEEDKQIEKDRKSLLKIPTAIADVVQMPLAKIMNIGGEGVEQAANYGGRAINAITGSPTLRTDYESPTFGNTPFYDRFVGEDKETYGRGDTFNTANTAVPAKASVQSGINGPYAPNADPAVIAAKEAKLLKDRFAAAPTEKRTSAEKRVPAENATPAPSAAYMPSAETTSKGLLAGMPQSVQDFMNKNPDTQSIEDIYTQNRAAKEKLIGPDTANAEYRKTIMDQKANAADEAYRLQQMRMAQFFSTWGSTPGATLVAGMKAARETIPNLVGDKDDQKKANAELNKIIHGLDHAERLEKEGDWNAAAKIKEDQAKNAANWSTRWQDLVQNAATNKSRETISREGNISAEKIGRERNASEERRTKISSGDTNTMKNLEFARRASDDYKDVEKEIEALKSKDKGPYQEALKIKNQMAKFAKDDPNGQPASMYNSAVDTLNKLETRYDARLKAAKATRDAFYSSAGYNTQAGNEGNDPFGLR
jgi:hypothetical protein